MASRRVFIVFVLPVISSVLFGSAVLFGILQQTDRGFDALPTTDIGEMVSLDSQIEIIGLSEQYTVLDPVEIQIKINDSAFDCGDLYITIYSAGSSNVVTQSRFFEQCYESANPVIPVTERFSEIIDVPGSYEVDVQLVSKQLKNISSKETFIVK